MKNDTKQFIEQTLEQKINANELGFLFVENYEKVPKSKWPVIDCCVFPVIFDKQKEKIKQINFEEVDMQLSNPEIVKQFIETKYPDQNMYPSHQLVWNMNLLEERLLRSISFNTKNTTLPQLNKDSYSLQEIEELCKISNNINHEDYEKANKRATNISRAI